MAEDPSKSSKEPGFIKIIFNDIKTFFDDIRRGLMKDSLGQEFDELKAFFLDSDRRRRLEKMNTIKRWLFMTGWLLKALMLKLTSTRRILTLISLFLILSRNDDGDNNKAVFGSMLLLFVLLLELKDKLMARNELAAGRTVQNALMPDTQPDIPGWQVWLFSRPANEVGGDLVDYLPVNSNRFGIALGDVAGKGLGAALLMAKLQATLRALAPDVTSLGDLGTRMNRIMYRDGLPNSFASLVYLEIAPESGDVAMLNAGHLPPVVLRHSQLTETEKGQPAMGLTADITYKELKLDLQRGEFLIVFSDGLTEARNAEGEFYGEKRLFQLLPTLSRLSVEDLGNRVLQGVEHFVGHERVNDDLSMVILKRTDNG